MHEGAVRFKPKVEPIYIRMFILTVVPTEWVLEIAEIILNVYYHFVALSIDHHIIAKDDSVITTLKLGLIWHELVT